MTTTVKATVRLNDTRAASEFSFEPCLRNIRKAHTVATIEWESELPTVGKTVEEIAEQFANEATRYLTNGVRPDGTHIVDRADHWIARDYVSEIRKDSDRVTEHNGQTATRSYMVGDLVTIVEVNGKAYHDTYAVLPFGVEPLANLPLYVRGGYSDENSEKSKALRAEEKARAS